MGSPAAATGSGGLLTTLLGKVGLGGQTKPPERQDKPSTSTVDERLTRNFISDRWAKIRTSYLTYHQLIWQSILFYVGQTWITWNAFSRTYYPSVPEDEYTPQPKINRYSPAVDAIATLFNTIPLIEAVGKDADGDEQYIRHGIARVASKLARHFQIMQGLKSDFRSQGDQPSNAGLMYVLCGTLFTAVRCIESTKDTPLGPQTICKIDMDLLPALEVLPRPGSTEFGKQNGTPYWFVARRMTLDEAWNRLGVVVEADVQFVDGYNSTYENALNYFYTGFNATDIQNEDSALIVEVYVPPASDNAPGVKDFYDQGLYAVYANDGVKYAKDWDFPEQPFTKFSYIPVPKMFFSRSIAFDLVNLQCELQEYEAIIKLHAMCNAVGPWVVDQNTMVGEITGRADKVIKYRSLGPTSIPPKREAPGQLDQGVYAKLQQLKEEFENLSGAASVFRGRQEGAVTAGTAIAQLRGQAEQMFSGPQIRWTNGWKETVRKAVKYMQKYYTIQQIVEVVGQGHMDAITDFKNCPDLDNAVEWLGSAKGLPRTQDELRAEMLDMFDKGAIDITQSDVREKIFELFGETGMMAQFNLDATRARMENKNMKRVPKMGPNGQPLPPMPGQPPDGPIPPTFMPMIEDLKVHLDIHGEAIKSLEFDSLPPPNKTMMIQHYLETKMAMEAIAAGQPMGAGGPGEPAGAGPGDTAGGPPKPRGPGLGSHGHPTTATHHQGQGIQPIGASKGAPPAASGPPNPVARTQ
jgi:hypothetical protein